MQKLKVLCSFGKKNFRKKQFSTINNKPATSTVVIRK